MAPQLPHGPGSQIEQRKSLQHLAVPDADRHAHEVDRAVVDLAEALLLKDRCGEVFRGVVVETGAKGGEVQLRDPAVRARLDGPQLPLGEEIDVRLVAVDVTKRRVTFERA